MSNTLETQSGQGIQPTQLYKIIVSRQGENIPQPQTGQGLQRFIKPFQKGELTYNKHMPKGKGKQQRGYLPRGRKGKTQRRGRRTKKIYPPRTRGEKGKTLNTY